MSTQQKIPQLRVVLNTTCGKHCVYCRPSGESACPVAPADTLSTEGVLACIQQLVKGGIQEVRLTGGDPAFYPPEKLVWLVQEIAKLGLYRVSLVTRSHKIRPQLASLKRAGLTHLTFSLDSMDAGRWTKICGLEPFRQGEHARLLETIADACAQGLHVNLNCVLLDETGARELSELTAFAQHLGISLKVEEVIRDIGGNGEDGRKLHANLEPLKDSLRALAQGTSTVYVHGGLGHPMEVVRLAGGATVTWKLFSGGACYGPSCRTCDHFPCDDALMALRLLPNGRLQTCLKREDNLVDLAEAIRNGRGADIINQVLDEYRHADRLSYDQIESFRQTKGCQIREVA